MSENAGAAFSAVRRLDLLTKAKVPLIPLPPEHRKALRLSQRLAERDRTGNRPLTSPRLSRLRTGGSSPGDIWVSSRRLHQLLNC